MLGLEQGNQTCAFVLQLIWKKSDHAESPHVVCWSQSIYEVADSERVRRSARMQV